MTKCYNIFCAELYSWVTDQIGKTVTSVTDWVSDLVSERQTGSQRSFAPEINMRTLSFLQISSATLRNHFCVPLVSGGSQPVNTSKVAIAKCRFVRNPFLFGIY